MSGHYDDCPIGIPHCPLCIANWANEGLTLAESLQKVIAERDALAAALREIVQQSGTSFHYGSKASAELANIALAALDGGK